MPGRKHNPKNKQYLKSIYQTRIDAFYFRKEIKKMRYGYDLKKPMEKRMYMEMRKREFERLNNKDLTLSQAYTEYLKDRQKEIEYFRDRDNQEKEMEQQKEQFIKEVEKETENAVNKILKSLKFD